MQPAAPPAGRNPGPGLAPLRRLVALVMLLALTASALESVLGVLRDGEVHHESRAAAAVHDFHASGDHGHEDRSASGHPDGSHPHGPGHHHGTAADHCTHHHGTPLPASVAFHLIGRTLPLPSFESQVRTDGLSTSLFRPPRA